MFLKIKSIKATGVLLAASLLFAACEYDVRELGPAPDASFTVAPISGQVNKFLLTSTSTNAFMYDWDRGDGKGWIRGKNTDTVYFAEKGSYTVRLMAFGHSGIDTASQVINVAADDPAAYNPFKLLTTRRWKLDPTAGANAIIVGTEGNPSQYFGGGALADCQVDDVYTFTADNKLNYNANGSTFYAGNISPNFTCGADLSYSNVSYTFSNTVSGAGIATITLSSTPPTHFIGVTDVSSNNYRIISISPTAMVLRSGTTSQTVHQFKFIAVP